MPALTAIRRRLEDERGFTMIIAMMVTMMVLLLSAAAYAAVNGDINVGLKSNKQKVAYAAAEAGVNAYLYQLNNDQNFWRRCDGKVSGVYASDWTAKWVNQPLAKSAVKDTRTWANLTGSNAQYTVELLPATGTVCNPDDPDGTMFDSTSSTFRIRATGRATSDPKTERSIVATFKRRGFLDYIYYTDKEDQSPKIWNLLNTYGGQPASATAYPAFYATSSTSGDLGTWGATQCEKYWRNGRGTATYPGKITIGGNQYNYPAACGEIVFGTGENIKGPFHTNDSIYNCGTPVFGRTSDDAIEISDSGSSATRGNAASGCADSATFNGTLTKGAPLLSLPATNQSMKSDATISLAGATKLTFNPNGTVTAITNTAGTSAGTTTTTYTLATNNVIYVDNRGCTPPGYDVWMPKVYGGTTSSDDLAMCGGVSVSGTYTKNVTVASYDDIVVTDDLVHPSGVDAMLGLVANNFIRIAHPSSWDSNGSASCATQLCALTGGSISVPKCTNSNSNTQNINLQAAMLAVNGSFTVDRYYCGAGLGSLNVTGAIAQGHRGTVGVSGGSNGFSKNYAYDNRLQYRTPPKFLDPVNSAWSVARQIEQSPATGAGLAAG